jgi:V8-like Glu-specific endopeptidase
LNTYGEETIVIDVDTDGGDSGSPYYEAQPFRRAYISGIHYAGVDHDSDGDFDEAKGHIMAYAEEVLDVTV